jgi:hypothetical protein
MLVLYGCGFYGCNGLGSPSSTWIGWAVYLSSFLSLSLFVMVPVVAFFPYSVCATPTLFVLFAPVFALLSARCRYPSSFFSLSILPLFCSLSPVLFRSVYRAERTGSSPLPTYTDSFPRPPLLSFYPSTPFQIAELLHTAHTCLVPSVY